MGGRRRPRICILSPYFGNPRGGGEIITQTMAAALIREGADVEIVTGYLETRRPEFRERQVLMPVVRRLPFYVLKYVLEGNPVFDAAVARFLVRAWRERPPDVVRIDRHMLFHGALRAVKHFRRRGREMRLVLDLMFEPDRRYHARFYGVFTRLVHRLLTRGWSPMLRAVDYVNASTRVMKRELAEKAGLDPRRIVTINMNLVDDACFSRRNVYRSRRKKRYTFVAPGRLVPEKGFELLLRSMALLSRVRRDFRLHIIGDGPYKESFERLARRKGLGDLVVFSGWMPNDKLARWYRRADIVFVLNQYVGIYSQVLTEAMTYGRPIVCPDIGSYREIVTHRTNGMRTRIGDPESVRDATLDFLQDPALANRLARNAYWTAVRTCNAKSIARELLRFYARITRGVPAPRRAKRGRPK